MKLNAMFLGALAAVALTGCPDPGFPQPEGTVPLNFTIDASGRPDFYADEDLEWKGSFTFDKETRLMTYAADWAGGNGPYAPTYDDGPWTEGGHEPEGNVAGDDKFGITAFFPVPTEAVTINYGAQTCCGATGGWIWNVPGGDGSLTIPANATTAITATGMTLSPAGNNDLKLMLDTNNLASGWSPSTQITVKGTFYLPNPWSARTAYDDGTHGDATNGDGIYTYTVGLDETPLLLPSGKYEFIWMIGGTATANEYKVGGDASTTGVTAQYKAGAGSFTTASVTVETNHNTAATIP